MKMIIAMIRPEKFEEVQDALDAQHVHLMTATDVRGCGTQRGYAENYRGNKGVIRLLSKVKLEIAVNDAFVEPTIQAILKAAHTGKIGDGKIFVLPLDEAYRIRTGEKGGIAIGAVNHKHCPAWSLQRPCRTMRFTRGTGFRPVSCVSICQKILRLKSNFPLHRRSNPRWL